MHKHSLGRILVVVSALLAVATLACGNVPQRPDSRATVQAFYATITQQAASGSPFPTRVVSTQPAGATTAPQATQRPAATPTVSPTPPDARTGLGRFETIRQCPADVFIQIDGDLADWQNWPNNAQPSNMMLEHPFFGEDEWVNATDLSGLAYLCWTDSALFILVQVTDDIHVQTETGITSWKGDEIEFFFDGDLQGDYFDDDYNDDDSQISLSPGNFDTIAPNATLYRPGLEVLDGDDLPVAARRSPSAGGNYILEAAIPWSMLRTDPEAGSNYGLCVAISDNDHVNVAQQDSMVSNCTELETPDPTTFATVRFE